MNMHTHRHVHTHHVHMHNKTYKKKIATAIQVKSREAKLTAVDCSPSSGS